MTRNLISLVFLLMMSVYGCTTIPAPRYYQISVNPAAVSDVPSHPYRNSLRVARFRAVYPLRQDSIVTYRQNSARIDFSLDDYWEDSPPDIVKREVTEAFRASQLFTRVDSRPSNPPATYLIRGRVLRFNQLQTDDGSYGEVALEVEFVDQKNRAVLWSAVLEAYEQASGDDVEAVTRAVGMALENCIREMIQQVKHATAYERLSNE